MHKDYIKNCIFLINEEKEFGKNAKQIVNGKILMLCADEALAHLKLMINGLCSNYFW